MRKRVEYDVKCSYRKPYTAVINEITECPIYKKSIKPELKYGEAYKDDDGKEYLILNYKCAACEHCFIAQYSNGQRDELIGPTKFPKIDYVAPNKMVVKKFDKNIEEKFEKFVKVYNEAYEAEQYNLEEICGMGYRKALEYLIKDFLKNQIKKKT